MTKKEKNKVLGGILIATVVLLAIIAVSTLFASINIIEDGTVGVVRTFGEIRETIQPGLNVRMAWWTTVEVYDVRTQELSLDFSAYSVDAQNVQGTVSIQYRLIPGAVQQIAREFGSLEELQSMVEAMFNQQIINTIASRTATYLVEEVAQLSGEIFEAIRPNQENFHIQVTNVAVEGLRFSDAFRQAVDARIVAREFQEQTRVEVETERLRAQLELDVARLQGEAVVVAAQADADAMQIMMEIWDELAIDVRSIMLQQLAIEAWNGVLPNVVVNGGDEGGFSLIIDSFMDSPAVRPATQAPVSVEE